MSRKYTPVPRGQYQQQADWNDVFRAQISDPDSTVGYNRFGKPGQPYTPFGSGIGPTSQGALGSSSVSTGTVTAPTTPVKPDVGFIDSYFYCDSTYKDPSSNLAQGRVAFNIAALNNNQSVNNVVEMEIESFYIPNIDNFPTDLPIPATFFYRRNLLLIQELIAQAYFGPNGERFHWEVDVSPAGIAYAVVPIAPKFVFGKPILDISKITLILSNPVETIPFPTDTFAAFAIAGTGTSDSNPLQLQMGVLSGATVTPVPHGLNPSPYLQPPPTSAFTATVAGQFVPPNYSAGLSVGNYMYVVTFVTPQGETNAGPATAPIAVAAANSYMNLLNIPVDPSGQAIARKIYRTKANGTTYQLDLYIMDNTTTAVMATAALNQYGDSIPDAGLTTPLSTFNTTGGSLYTVYISMFNSASQIPSNIDPYVNNTQGVLVSVVNSTTVALTNTPLAATLTAPGIPGTVGTANSLFPCTIEIAYRRIAFGIRFRQLCNGDSNRIFPVSS